MPFAETNLLLTGCLLASFASVVEDLGARWGTAAREREFYRIVDVPIPEPLVIEAGAITRHPDGRMVIGTRRGDVFFVSGVDDEKPDPVYHQFATGLDEIFGLAYRDGALYVTQSCELTRVTDTSGDGRADRFETISDAWGYENYHEYAFGSEFDERGKLHVALGLSQSYNSRALFRGWALQVTPEGETVPIASGLRSPAGIGPNEHGQLFYIESQGPWNSSCSLKALTPGSFQGHPVSFNWYEFAPNMGPAPNKPEPGTRIATERERVPELVPYAVVFPYIRMGRSISGFTVDRTGGRFGPFQDQMFIGDFSLSLVMRVTTEEVDGVWQGACYPFREGLSTGLLDVEFTPDGKLLTGGTNRGWPVRGIEPFALQRLEWTGVLPFEIERVTIAPRGFDISFTKAVDAAAGGDPASYELGTFTHIYHGAYGGPEVDQTKPTVQSVELSEDGLHATLVVDGMQLGHVHEFDLGALRSREGDELLHRHAYYTVNAIPQETTPGETTPGETTPGETTPDEATPEESAWLDYSGGAGPGAGKRVVLIAADQEYRSEQSLPMLAKLLSEHHGFDCTVLFSVNEAGEVDPTKPIRWEDETVLHDIPGIEQLADADLVILFSRLITLPPEQLQPIYDYLDSGKPLIGIRTANHGFIGFDYEKDGERVRFGDDVLGGSFRGHHGRWHADSTRGMLVEQAASHPVLRGVSDIWGPSDVYRTYEEGGGLDDDCTPLVYGQPLTGRDHDDPINLDLIALPVAWTKTWTGNRGETARVFHTTMGSAKDFESAGLRRLTVNAVYWCLGMEDEIRPDSCVDLVGEYEPLPSGFNYERLGVRPHPVSYYK